MTPTGALRARWSVLMVLVTAVLITLANVAFTSYVQRQGDQRQAEQQQREKRAQEASQRQTLAVVCAWLELRINPEPPPTTARGREQLAADQRLYQQFGCKETKR
ncbi:hypothetical protein [Actinomadura rugatobispora]|uniref:Uncharacterized protein n=1 Tax=Actinomadura rugatobispora TaxID=1994 RepID=A0ABW0ZNI4_9ACTN|nr:hypothetical protein GCM10010200_036610 [Actinomadura rugatobispora]